MTLGETDDYLEHLRICQVCHRLAKQFQGAADLLSDTLAIESASPDLKQRVLAQASAEAERTPRSVTPRTDSPPRGLLSWFWPARVSQVPAVAIVVLVIAVLGLSTWNIALRQELSDLDQILLQRQEVINAIVASGQVHEVPGTEAAPEASAVLIQNPGKEDSLLIIAGLASLPAGMEYQIWLIKDEDASPIGAGTFSVTDSGAQLVPISIMFSVTDTVGVSVEPTGGSLAPTGDIVLLGKL